MNPAERLSIVIPAFNEEENLPVLMKEILQAFPDSPKNWEVLLINDGSTDRTLEIMLELKSRHRFVRVFSLDRNHGLSAALDAGFQQSTGDVIVSLDSDLQNDPSDIPRLLEKI